MSSLGNALGDRSDNSDAFHFYHIGVRGDGDLVAKIGNMTGGGLDAKVGIMFRENTASDSRMTAVVLRAHQASTTSKPAQALFPGRASIGGNLSPGLPHPKVRFQAENPGERSQG